MGSSFSSFSFSFLDEVLFFSCSRNGEGISIVTVIKPSVSLNFAHLQHLVLFFARGVTKGSKKRKW